MKLRLSMKKPRAVFCVTVDWTYEVRQQRNQRSFKKENVESDVYRNAERVVLHAMSHELPRDISDIYGLEITTRHLATKEGSLLVFFEVIASGLSAISGYSEFVESIKLIRTHADRLLKKGFEREGIDDLEAGVRCDWPDMDSEERFFHRFFSKGPGGGRPFIFESEYRPKRDGFFYFLLCLCIIQAAALAALLYVAVKKTYFGPNQTLQPTPMSVTAPAAQEPRRP